MSRGARTWLILSALLAVLAPSHHAHSSPYEPLLGIVHIHSRASSGIFSLEEIARRAEALGIDVVILAENYHLQFTYGLPPLQDLFMVSKSFPSLTRSTIARYLKEVEETNRRHPRVILVPGVETVPHYFWTGSLLGNDLTMHNGQKNMLVVGLKRPEEYQALPITGNPGAGRYGSGSFLRASPLLLVVVGLGLLSLKKKRHYKVGGFRVTQRQRPWKAALSLILIGGLWSAYNAPFTVPAWPTTGPDTGLTPYQSLIDYVNSREGLTIWSYPEAKDFHVYSLPFLPRAGKFTIKTDPYPEALLETRGYTAFGAVYQDTITAERPGKAWDYALEQYCMGERQRPPWGLGELGFHGADRKALSDVLTTFYVRERTAEGVLKALSSGRMYAVIPWRGIRFSLNRFAIRKGRLEAVMGETLPIKAGENVTLLLALEAHDGASHPFQATLVRNGKPWKELRGTTPYSTNIEDTPSSGRKCTYYRLWMEKPHRLITNPVFATQQQERSN